MVRVNARSTLGVCRGWPQAKAKSQDESAAQPMNPTRSFLSVARSTLVRDRGRARAWGKRAHPAALTWSSLSRSDLARLLASEVRKL